MRAGWGILQHSDRQGGMRRDLERFVEDDVLAVEVGSESHGHRERRVLLVAVPNNTRGDALAAPRSAAVTGAPLRRTDGVVGGAVVFVVANVGALAGGRSRARSPR